MGQAKNRGSFEQRKQQSIDNSKVSEELLKQAELEKTEKWDKMSDEEKEKMREKFMQMSIFYRGLNRHMR
jgi:hypothetical protein